MFRSAILQNMKITRFFRCTVHLLSRISSEKIKISIPSTLSLREEEITYRLLTTVPQRGRAQNRRVEIKIYNSFNSNVKENN